MYPQCYAGEDSAAEDRADPGAAKEKKVPKARAAASAKAVSRGAATLSAAHAKCPYWLQHVGEKAGCQPDSELLPSLRLPLERKTASMSNADAVRAALFATVLHVCKSAVTVSLDIC